MTKLSTASYTETAHSLEHTRLLLKVATAVSQSLDPQKVAKVALQLALEAMALKTGMVLLLNKGQRIILACNGFSSDWQRKFTSSPLDLKGSIIGQAIKTGTPGVFTNLRQTSQDPVARLFQDAQLQSLVYLPLKAPDNLLGMMLIGSPKAHAFKEEQVDLLQTIAGQIGVGLRNAWLFAQSQRQLKERQTVTEVARAVVSTLDSNQSLTRIMEEVTARLNAEAAAVLLLDSVQQELEFAAVAGPNSENLKGVRLPLGQGIAGWVAQHNQALLVSDVNRDPRFLKGLDKKTDTVTDSVVCVPLRARNQLIGVVEVLNKKRGEFSNSDQRLLEALAAFAAVAIENARFFEEANRQIQQATLYAHDLSATYKQERQQRKALDRLRYSFLNAVGHELKTPLTVILQGLEALKNPRRGLLNAEQTEIVQMLEQRSNYLHRLIEGLTAFATFSAKQRTMKFKEAPFATVLDEALTLSRFKSVRKNISLKERRQGPLPTLTLDKTQVSEAIVHLIDNAVKFSSEGSQVIVHSETSQDEVAVHIIDQGPGIPADQIDSIWDSFTQMNTTLERGLEGLGLGLAIARYIIEAHNGHISVESRAGEGSKFTIRLPYESPDKN